MKVHFEMSGGYGGLYAADPLAVDVDIEALPEDERAELRRMARDAMASPPVPDHPDVAPDLMTYRLRIDDGDRWEVVVDDRTMTEDMLPLVEYMQSIAIQKRMRS